jgi:hypothetical protein
LIGGVQATVSVVRALFRIVTNDKDLSAAVSACKFWLRSREGWSERAEYSGPGGKLRSPDRSTPFRGGGVHGQ